jgi:hypothetical protein
MSDIFGATEDDLQQLRIVSLFDVDMDKLDAMATEGGTGEEGGFA